MRKFLSLIAMFFFSSSVFCQSLTDESFLGEWCGLWDGMYSVCVSIDSVDDDSFAKYKWVEREGDGFKKLKRKLRESI